MIAHTPAALLHQAWREYSFRPQRLFFPTTHPTFQPVCRAIPEGPFLFRASRMKTNTTAECHDPCMNVLCVVLIIPPPIISATYFFLFPPPITREIPPPIIPPPIIPPPIIPPPCCHTCGLDRLRHISGPPTNAICLTFRE